MRRADRSVEVQVGEAATDFDSWDVLLQLLKTAFAYQEPRIDPPSSVYRLDPASLAEKSKNERLFLAHDKDQVVGCIFAREEPDALYVGKLAVLPERQGEGIGRRLMQAAEDHACRIGKPALTLETRIELTENHDTFGAMGFEKTGEHAHEGYERPTFISMRKQLGLVGDS